MSCITSPCVFISQPWHPSWAHVSFGPRPRADFKLGFVYHWISRLQAHNITSYSGPIRVLAFWKWKIAARPLTPNTFFNYQSVQVPGASVCFIYLKAAEGNALSASMCFHIVSLVQFYTRALNRFDSKHVKSLKITANCNLRVLSPLTSPPPRQSNVTPDYLYNPDLDIYFKIIAMGRGKLSLGLGGLCSITWHMPSVLLSLQIVFKDAELCM